LLLTLSGKLAEELGEGIVTVKILQKVALVGSPST